ncbi:MAG: N-acetylmuramoyl-L-alanine amidase [Thermoanaerobaculia bacterium]
MPGLNIDRKRLFFFGHVQAGHVAGGLALFALLVGAKPAEASTHRAAIEAGVKASLTAERELFLEAEPRRGEGLLGFTLRFCGERDRMELIANTNGGSGRLLIGHRYRIPFASLRPEWQLRVLRSLFKHDYPAANGWYHEVGDPDTYGAPSLWHVAEWFTGRGDNYRAIRAANELADDELPPGLAVLIPARFLRPALRSALPPESPFYLEYDADGAGDFALYRLKPGEALYSSVVVRFTGSVFADDVNALAKVIAERSGIDRVTAIPVGYGVKIPFELLEPEFLPAKNPRRREYEAGRVASSQYRNSVTARQLSGITVVLDSGHGGSDVGASHGDVWESVYVYDVMVRVKELLEKGTAARVHPTLRDGASHRTRDKDVLPASRQHTVLTNPRYLIEDSTIGLHLRWYLANSFLRQALDAASDSEKVVFLSIHADSLHPSLRGGMAYIPGARYGKGAYGREGLAYASRREVREQPKVNFSSKQRVKSEGLSRDLAEHLIDAFDSSGLAIHPDKPVREKVVRNRREWVPAVLRYNAVPAKVLLEICNLSNPEDRALLQTRAFREHVAEAIVEGIVAYYGDDAATEAPWASTTAR